MKTMAGVLQKIRELENSKVEAIKEQAELYKEMARYMQLN